MMKNPLTAIDPLTAQIKALGIKNWTDLIHFIQQLPYGRTANRTDLSLVITERKGTCSSKHALLKKVADLNDIARIELVIGIYKMSEENTPGIGNELSKNGLAYIPEAHCYLKVHGQQTDYTSSGAEFQKIQADILEELAITPDQITQFKVDYHKNYIKTWLKSYDTIHNFEAIWKIREQCIHNLSINN